MSHSFLRAEMLRIVQEVLLPQASQLSPVVLEPPFSQARPVDIRLQRLSPHHLKRGEASPGAGTLVSETVWPLLGMHTLPYAWLGFLYRGETQMRLGASRTLRPTQHERGGVCDIRLSSPSAFLIPPGVPHHDGSSTSWRQSPPCRFLWIMHVHFGVMCHIAEVRDATYSENFFVFLTQARLLEVVQLLIQEMRRPAPFEAVVSSVLQCFLEEMQRALSAPLPVPHSPFQEKIAAICAAVEDTSTRAVVLRAALSAIDSRLNWKRLSVDLLAEHAHVSPSYLRRLFREEFGVTIKEYTTSRRLQVACQLLRESDLSVGEVGMLVGFFPPSRFSHAFHKVIGLAPSRYRNEHRALSTQER